MIRFHAVDTLGAASIVSGYIALSGKILPLLLQVLTFTIWAYITISKYRAERKARKPKEKK